MDRNRGIIVIGMHRSGTSLTAELIHRWGAYGNLDSMLEADAYNPRGYWENASLVHFNDKLFQAVESSWRLPPGENEQPRLEALAHDSEYRAQAVALLDKMQKGSAPWFWKDPRLTVLLPFWKQLWGDVTYIVNVRDPEEIARSLKLRDCLSLASSLLIWQRYMSAILSDRDVVSSALFISYAGLLTNGIYECERLCKFLDRSFSFATPDADLRPEIMAQAITPELRRNRSVNSFSQSPVATSAQKALDGVLQRRAMGLVVEMIEIFGPKPSWRDDLISELSNEVRQQTPNFFQVFWRAPNCLYSEKHSRRVALREGDSRQSLLLEIPSLEGESLTALRLDFSAKPGLLKLSALTIVDAFSHIIWAWNGDERAIQKLPRHQIILSQVRLPDKACILELEGDDPWIEVGLDSLQASALSAGGAVVVDCEYVSPSGLFAEMVTWQSRIEALSLWQAESLARLQQIELRMGALGLDQLFEKQTETARELSGLGGRIKGFDAKQDEFSVHLRALEEHTDTTNRRLDAILQSRTWRTLTRAGGVLLRLAGVIGRD